MGLIDGEKAINLRYPDSQSQLASAQRRQPEPWHKKAKGTIFKRKFFDVDSSRYRLCDAIMDMRHYTCCIASFIEEDL